MLALQMGARLTASSHSARPRSSRDCSAATSLSLRAPVRRSSASAPRATSSMSMTSPSLPATPVRQFLTASSASTLSAGTSRLMPSSVALAVAVACSMSSRTEFHSKPPKKVLLSAVATSGGAACAAAAANGDAATGGGARGEAADGVAGAAAAAAAARGSASPSLHARTTKGEARMAPAAPPKVPLNSTATSYSPGAGAV